MAQSTYDAQPLPGSAAPLPEPADDIVELTPPPAPTPEEQQRQMLLLMHTVKLVVALVLLPILLFKIL